jgi:hypothetical protein
MDRVAAQRAIATLHSFRVFGLVFILPGVVSPICPPASPCSPPTATPQPLQKAEAAFKEMRRKAMILSGEWE